MRCKSFAIALFLFTSFALPVKAQTQPSESSPSSSPNQTTPALNQVAEACIQNRAETIPTPFTDVPQNHWAFKAVMTMHYCGAFRQAASPELFQQTTPIPARQPDTNSP